MLEKEVDAKGRVAMDTVRMNKEGELVDVAMVVAPLQVDGASVGYVLSFRDIGERKQLESKVQHDALFDVLTGLPNRALFLDRLTLALKRRMRRLDQNCGVLLLDIDRFKEINDTFWVKPRATSCWWPWPNGCALRCVQRIRLRAERR
jgi:predicted signal transduction protein with EAL and GGDEF domain